MGEVAAILDFARLRKSSGKLTLAQMMFFYYVLLEHCAKFCAFVRPLNIILLRNLTKARSVRV